MADSHTMLSALSAVRPEAWTYPLLVLELLLPVLPFRLRGALPIGCEEAHAYRPPNGNSRGESLVSIHLKYHTLAATLEPRHHRWHAYRCGTASGSTARVAMDGRQ